MWRKFESGQIRKMAQGQIPPMAQELRVSVGALDYRTPAALGMQVWLQTCPHAKQALT